MGRKSLEWLMVLADSLDDPELRPMAIMTFEALFTSTGMIQMGHEMLGIDRDSLLPLSQNIWEGLRELEFEPGELRSRAGTVLAGIYSFLPPRLGEPALRHANYLLGRDVDEDDFIRRVAIGNGAAESDDSIPGLDYTDGYMDGVLKGDELNFEDDEPCEVTVSFEGTEFE